MRRKLQASTVAFILGAGAGAGVSYMLNRATPEPADYVPRADLESCMQGSMDRVLRELQECRCDGGSVGQRRENTKN